MSIALDDIPGRSTLQQTIKHMDFNFHNHRITRHLFRIMLVLGGMILLLGMGGPHLPAAHADNGELLVDYQNNQVSVVAKNVTIQRVLTMIAEKTGIYVNYSADLSNTITLNKSGVSLRSALKTILKGWNHAIIYAGPANGKTRITGVLIFSEKHARPVSPTSSSNVARISTYERQIDALRQRLSRVDSTSKSAETYMKRIERLEERIQRLQGQ